MIPRGAEAIRHLVARVAMDLMPRAPDAYTQADLGYITALMGMIAQDYDRAAAVQSADYEAMRPILGHAAERLDDAALRQRIADVLAAPQPSLHVSALTARTDAALAVLIDAHAAVEEAEAAGAGWAAELDDEIWRFLQAHVAAHAYDVPF